MLNLVVRKETVRLLKVNSFCTWWYAYTFCSWCQASAAK